MISDDILRAVDPTTFSFNDFHHLPAQTQTGTMGSIDGLPSQAPRISNTFSSYALPQTQPVTTAPVNGLPNQVPQIPNTLPSSASLSRSSAGQLGTLRLYNIRTPPQPQAGNPLQASVNQLSSAAPYQHIPRVMPPRACVTQKAHLHYKFDLPAHQRAAVNIIPPTVNNQRGPVIAGMNHSLGRDGWPDHYRKYLFELVELAMLVLNRKLKPNDFKAITEALHRHFQANGGIPVRGWKNVHCFATRQLEHHQIRARVFPDVTFPAFTPQVCRWPCRHS
jgi:hypothetical protein